MVIMPNHFHCIIENVGGNGGNGVDGRDNGDDGLGENIRLGEQGEHIGLGENIRLGEQGEHIGLGENIRLGEQGEHIGLGEHIGSPVRAVVGWFKTMTTNAYIRGVKQLGWPPFDGKLWQRNYYEHIIRNEQSYQNISNYIINNPAHWKDD